MQRMINKYFKKIRNYFSNGNLPKFIFFNNLKETQFYYIKKIAIWLMCNKKELLICKKCNSCINFKRQLNYDYYEIIENNEEDFKNKILNLDNFLKTKPIYSDIKIIFLSLTSKNKNFIKIIEKISNDKKIYFLFSHYDDFINLKTNYLIFNFKKTNFLISINIVKKIYNCIANKDHKNIFLKKIDLTKTIIINSLIFFLIIYLPYNDFKKNKILMNSNVKKQMPKKKVLFLLNFLYKYKKVLSKNDNLNIFLIINFVINQITN